MLLIKEWSNKRNGHFWNLVKGTYGDNENESLAECAIREAKEEAGIDITIKKLLSCYTYIDDVVGLQFNFLALPSEGATSKLTNKNEQKSRGEDIIEIKWITKEELSEINPDEFISKKIYKVIQDWINNTSYNFEILSKEVIK